MGKLKQRPISKSGKVSTKDKAMYVRRDSTGHFVPCMPGRAIGLRADNPAEVVRRIEAGLPFVTIEKLRKVSGFDLDRIGRIIRISKRTLARRKEQGVLNSEESERVLRLATVIERAIELFDGDLPAAKRWLEMPRRNFGGKPALEFAETEVGAAEVRDLIGRIEHGVIS